MTVRRLREMLEDCDERTEVRIVLNQYHPMDYELGEVQDQGVCIYLATGPQIGYHTDEEKEPGK